MSDPADPADRPAKFSEAFANREYRAIFAASSLSWLGDNAARAAVTALVYLQTESVLASAATFTISYLPWLGIGSVLSAFAERHELRRVMILCDLGRMAIMAFLAAFTLPVPVLMLLLLANALLSPPFDSARSALLPSILDGDRYVVAISVQKTAGQIAIILGYAAGALLVPYDAQLALLFNAATFGFSALLVTLWVRAREPILRADQRTGLLRETAEGYRLVFGSPVMRAIALITFGGVCFGVVPEGLAAAWAAQLADDHRRGVYQGAIMVAGAIGFIAGSLIVTRLLAPSTRIRLIRPFAVLTPLALVPAVFDLGIVGVVTMTLVSGATLAGILPATNGLFVQVLPPAFRARAFGVMQSGLYLVQGGAIVFTGWLAGQLPLPTVVGLFSAVGVGMMVLVSVAWPAQATIADAIAANKIQAAADEYAAAPATAGAEFGEDTLDLGRGQVPPRRPRPGKTQRTNAPRPKSAGHGPPTAPQTPANQTPANQHAR